MSPITHFLVGWNLANATELNQRERLMVSVVGIIPDLDGFGIGIDLLTRSSDNPTDLWGEYHHVLGHNIGFAVTVSIFVWLTSRNKMKATLLAWISFHLHLLGDLFGARGPDGDQWPIPYLLPFSDSWQWVWQGQWALNAWPNMLITAGLILSTLILACRKGFSPLEIISLKADKIFVDTIQARFRKV
jgi:membrane-bound metal-dependent hydrolase YbcI (DUF457 family)